MNRTEQIKGYLKRLGDGESLENVKKDFVRNSIYLLVIYQLYI